MEEETKGKVREWGGMELQQQRPYRTHSEEGSTEMGYEQIRDSVEHR